MFLHPGAFAPRYRHCDTEPHKPVGMPGRVNDFLSTLPNPVRPTVAPAQVLPGAWVTGPIPRKTSYEDAGGPFFKDAACSEADLIEDDQALWLESSEGIVVALGCAHAGVINTLDYISGLTGQSRICAVIGGMHLQSADETRLSETIQGLKSHQVNLVAPCHCTGTRAMASLQDALPGSLCRAAAAPGLPSHYDPTIGAFCLSYSVSFIALSPTGLPGIMSSMCRHPDAEVKTVARKSNWSILNKVRSSSAPATENSTGERCLQTGEIEMTENAAAKMERVDFRGMDVWYRRAGAGKPLLFLHNGGNSHIIWQRQLQHFAASHECFAFDLPGYGKSVNLSMRYSLQFYVDFLREFMTQMGIEKVTLVGNCVGSAISLSHAIEQPESVERLILFNILTKATVWDGILGPFFKLTAPVPFMRPLLKSTFGGIRSPAVVSRYSVAKQYGNKSVRDPRLDAELCALYRQKGTGRGPR